MEFIIFFLLASFLLAGFTFIALSIVFVVYYILVMRKDYRR